MLEAARAHFDDRQVVITPNGGFRCEIQNKKVGGVPNSQHTQGKAADHVILGVSVADLYEYYTLTYPNTAGIGHYKSNFVHLDSRFHPARWSG